MVPRFKGSVSRYCYSSVAVVKMATERTTRDFSTGMLSLLVGICLVAFALAMAGCATSPDVFDVNRRQAVKNSQTPEAKDYVQAFYPAIGQDLANLLKKCTSDFPAAEVDSFELVFRIDRWGEPKAVLVKPVTDLTTCVATGFWYFRFPHPDRRFEKTGLALLMPISIR